MHLFNYSSVSILACTILCALELVDGSEELYKTLGVRKTASKKEIKIAYKKLALEWHPDRNNDPKANDHFMKINEAYETLSDADKRQDYDRFGRTSGEGQKQQRRSPFGNFGNFHFDFGAGSGINDDLIEKHNVNYNVYKNRIIPDSKKKPYFIYVYAEFCMGCMHVARMWDKIVNDMDNIGMGIATVHANSARNLVHELQVSSVPALYVVIDGRSKQMEGQLNLNGIRNFIRTAIPQYTVQEVTDQNYVDFLSGWPDNKIRMLFSDSKAEPSLRYLMPAFTHRDRFIAGYVNLNNPHTLELQAKLQIQKNGESLLIFHEDIEYPVARARMNVLPRDTIESHMDSHRHLQLPRLSSQDVLDELCPPYSNIKNKKLCVVLLTQNTVTHKAYVDSLRLYAQRHKSESERIKYTYVYHDTQAHFINKVLKSDTFVNSTSGALKLAIIWRKDVDLMYFDWLSDGWYADEPHLDNAHAQLGLLVSGWLDNKEPLPFVTTLNVELFNEHGYSLPYRILVRLINWSEAAKNWIFNMDEVSLVMVVSTLMCLGLVYAMGKNMLQPEPQQTRRPQVFDQRQERFRQQYEKPVVNISPLSASTYEQLVFKQEPGVRIIVMFVDDERKMKLVQLFAAAVQPFARSKAFKFAFLMLEDHLEWFKNLLKETLDSKDISNINQKNCLGTVLAMNGPRKSYSIYHAHTHLQQVRSGGDFLGFDQSEESGSDEEHADKIFERDLLCGLDTWLERLCEGTVKRFRIQKWPQMK